MRGDSVFVVVRHDLTSVWGSGAIRGGIRGKTGVEGGGARADGRRKPPDVEWVFRQAGKAGVN